MAPRRKPPTVHYLIRGVDPELWGRFKARADARGESMRTALLNLVGAYADGKIDIVVRTVTTLDVTAPKRASK